MRSPDPRQMVWLSLLGIVLSSAVLWAQSSHADQIEMINGDRYVGRVVSLGADHLVVESEMLGTVKLPRSRISTITLSSPAAARTTNAAVSPLLRSTNLAKASLAARTNSAPDLTSAFRELGNNSNLVQQVQQQLLGAAGPEAQTKFNDLMGGLISGKLNMDDLRAEAKSTLAQAKSARKELGEENGSMLDSYLSILEGFLKETEPELASTNAPAKPTGPTAPRPLVGE